MCESLKGISLSWREWVGKEQTVLLLVVLVVVGWTMAIVPSKRSH